MGGKRYWNKLRSEKKKSPNPHKVYSVSIPNHILKRTNWKEGDNIGFQLFGNKERASIELINLSKENKAHTILTFIRLEEQHKDFLNKITPKNLGDFSKSMQDFFKRQMNEKINLKETERQKRLEKSEKNLEEVSIQSLKKEIKYRKKDNKKRIKLMEKFFNNDIKEKERQFKKMLKKTKKPPKTAKSSQN